MTAWNDATKYFRIVWIILPIAFPVHWASSLDCAVFLRLWLGVHSSSRDKALYASPIQVIESLLILFDCRQEAAVFLPTQHGLHLVRPCSGKPDTYKIFTDPISTTIFKHKQYLGLAALLLNFSGFFSHAFHEDSTACEHFFRLMIITQCFASWASHAVFVVRTIAISNKDKVTTIGLVVLAVITSGLEIFSQLFSFFKFKTGSSGNCLIQFSDNRNISWLYYLVRRLACSVMFGMFNSDLP